MNKSESKFHNTAVKMNEALFRILEKKDFSKISVLEICKEAGVNRSTFYAHYDNTYELLQEAHSNFVKNFFDGYSDNFYDFKFSDTQSDSFVSPRYIIPYLEFVRKNKNVFKVFINNTNTFDIYELYELLLQKLFIPACKKQGITDNAVITYISKFYLTGMTSIVMEWINKNCEEDVFFICELIMLCVRTN